MEAPPAVVGGLYVVEYAHADDSVRFEQRNTLNVGGTWLGRVPNLAVCQHFDRPEFLIQHCSESWEPLGVAAGYKSIDEAKEPIERSYHGIAGKWIKSKTGKEEARAAYTAELKAEACSFCGRTMLEVTAMIGEQPRICNRCVDDFHRAIHSRET